MRVRTNVIILVIAVSVTAIVGFIGVTTGRSLTSQASDASTKAADKICDPTDCHISEGKRPENCACRYSVVLVEFGNSELNLTNVQNGVGFNLDSEGHGKQRVSWTAANSAGAFLYLDRNTNKKVDNGLELFSNSTDQVPTSGVEPNGLLSLARQDRAELGGNGDGVIDSQDAVFTKLRLWQDLNHNGISEPGELRTLKDAGIDSISLDYKRLEHVDQWGNLIRYNTDVFGANHQKLGRAYDVVLLPAL